MKHYIYWILMLILCIGCAKKQPSNAGIFVSPLYEWGTSYLGDTIKAEISCVNSRDEDIIIDYFDVPCDCITARPRRFRVKQGDSTVIDVSYKPQGTGYTEKRLFLYFQNIETPFMITLKGRIKQQL